LSGTREDFLKEMEEFEKKIQWKNLSFL
jgi:hypothetical protein